MTSYLYAQQIKVFDYAKELADPLRHKIRDNAQMLAKAHGVAIEHVNNSHLRKEDLVSKVLAQRGDHPGLGSKQRGQLSVFCVSVGVES
jgi:hypothetical protein